MSCTDADVLLVDMALGWLPDPVEDHLARHMSGCTGCRIRWAETLSIWLTDGRPVPAPMAAADPALHPPSPPAVAGAEEPVTLRRSWERPSDRGLARYSAAGLRGQRPRRGLGHHQRWGAPRGLRGA